MRFFGNALLLFVLGLILLPATLSAQNKKYTLSGQIFDSITGAPISNPNVNIAGTAYKTIGSTKGYYKIDKLIPGTNNLLVWADGYDTAVIRFEIRKNMRLNVKLMQVLDTASLHIEEIADTTNYDSNAKPLAEVKTKKSPKKEKKKKPAKTDLTEKEKEEIKVLIEDVIFSKAIFFESFKNKRRSIYVKGSFTIDTGYLYTFKAKFSKKNGFELLWFDFKLKGKHSN